MGHHESVKPSDDSPGSPRSILRGLFAAAGAKASGAALQAASEAARAHGLVVLQLGLQEASTPGELAGLHAAIALQGVRHGRPAAPTVILSGGPVQAKRGGAAQFLLALVLALDENPAIYAYACGSDSDSEDSAGVGLLLTPDTARRAQELRINPAERFVAGEAQALFEQLGDCVRTDATGSRGDVLRAILLAQE